MLCHPGAADTSTVLARRSVALLSAEPGKLELS